MSLSGSVAKQALAVVLKHEIGDGCFGKEEELLF